MKKEEKSRSVRNPPLRDCFEKDGTSPCKKRGMKKKKKRKRPKKLGNKVVKIAK